MAAQNASAENDDAWIEQTDDAPEPRGVGIRVIHRCAAFVRDRRTRRQRLNTSRRTASTNDGTTIIDGYVAGLARSVVRAAKKFAVEHDTRSDAGTDRRVENDRVSAARAVESFAERACIAIVFETNRQPELLLGHLGQRNIDPAR